MDTSNISAPAPASAPGASSDVGIQQNNIAPLFFVIFLMFLSIAGLILSIRKFIQIKSIMLTEYLDYNDYDDNDYEGGFYRGTTGPNPTQSKLISFYRGIITNLQR